MQPNGQTTPDQAVQEQLNKLPEPGVHIGDIKCFSTAQLASAFGVPEYHFKRIVQDPQSGLYGEKVGKQYFIEEGVLRRWIETGKFKYRPRPSRRVHTAESDIETASRREEERIARKL